MKSGDYISIPMTRAEWLEIADLLGRDLRLQPVQVTLQTNIRQRLRDPRSKEDTRYSLMSDDDGHKYVVPVGYSNHFEKILLDDGDPAEYYTRVEGGLTFTDPLEL